MAGNYDSIDLDFTWDGDFMIDQMGDLKDTSNDMLLSIQNEIYTVVKSAIGEWREDSGIGAGLEDFIGEPNDRRTAENMQTRLEAALGQILNTRDLSVRIVPVHIYKVLIMINLEVLPTTENKLKSGTVISTNFLYDYFEKGVYVDIDDMSHFAGRGL